MHGILGPGIGHGERNARVEWDYSAFPHLLSISVHSELLEKDGGHLLGYL